MRQIYQPPEGEHTVFRYFCRRDSTSCIFADCFRDFTLFSPLRMSGFAAVGFEMWHLELILGLVLLISSSRYLLLKTWPDFSQSSEAANQQVCFGLSEKDS